MICHFLLLQLLEAVNNSKIPGKCQKQDSVYYTGENELPQSVGAVPSFYCPPTQFSPASATARRSCLTTVPEFPGKCYS